MKLPKNEKEFEKMVLDSYAGIAWAKHMDTTIPGFPDSLIIRNGHTFFVEFKFIRDRDLGKKALSLFQSSQPGQLANMVIRGADIFLYVYFNGFVASAFLTLAEIASWRDLTILEWLTKKESFALDDFLKSY